MSTSSQSGYASPRHVDGLDDCYFYHSIKLPEFGEIEGDWDLRGCAGEYLGNADLQGKRVIDVGTASGFLTFEMEKRGAEVVSYDMPTGRDWDTVPHQSKAGKWDQITGKAERSAEKLKNSYWLSHRLLGSGARACYRNIYEPLPESIGEFDVAFFGMIFTHLRDPFGALSMILPKVRETVIVTNHFMGGDKPLAAFTPSKENQQLHAFWIPSVACVAQMVEIFGFELERVVPCVPGCRVPNYDTSNCAALVATRR